MSVEIHDEGLGWKDYKLGHSHGYSKGVKVGLLCGAGLGLLVMSLAILCFT